MSFPAAAADQSLTGPGDPEAVGPSALPGTSASEQSGSEQPLSEQPLSEQSGSEQPSSERAGSEVAPGSSTTLPTEVVDVARSAAIEEAGKSALVGDYLGAVREDAVAVTASFVAADRGYRGWYWSVTLALVEPGHQTVSEVVLLPGEQALLAPSWVPWDQRIRSGDVGAGDLLPTAPDDPRLVPGYLDSDDPAVQEVAYEFGFGRLRVLSREGRDDAAQRWHDGPFGPDDVVAQQAQANCVTCGFYVPLAGLLGMALGACSNEFSPADGRVVDAAYGCGAHSDTVIDAPLISASTATVVDELTLEVHRRPRPVGQVGGDLLPEVTVDEQIEVVEPVEVVEQVAADDQGEVGEQVAADDQVAVDEQAMVAEQPDQAEETVNADQPEPGN